MFTDLEAPDPAVHHFVNAQLEHVAFAQRTRTKEHRVVELRVDSGARRGQPAATESRVPTVQSVEAHLAAKVTCWITLEGSLVNAFRIVSQSILSVTQCYTKTRGFRT